MHMAGYSGTPLAKKLGINPGAKILTLNAPKEYRAWLAPLPAGVLFLAGPSREGVDIVHLFVVSLYELEKSLPRAHRAMRTDGALWVSWYKKAAKIPTDVTEDLIRACALKTDLVDVKVCAVSEEWSGLKLVVRKERR
jgi:hypothetical protein